LRGSVTRAPSPLANDLLFRQRPPAPRLLALPPVEDGGEDALSTILEETQVQVEDRVELGVKVGVTRRDGPIHLETDAVLSGLLARQAPFARFGDRSRARLVDLPAPRPRSSIDLSTRGP